MTDVPDDPSGSPPERSKEDQGRDTSGNASVRGPGVVRRAVMGASDVVDSVESAGRSLGGPVVRRVEPTVRAAARHWRNREAARRARLRALNREPLPNLYDEHPETRLAPVRELGLKTIPVAEIVGTAVEGPVQRGRDFRPPPPLRTPNWVARWQRIRKAQEALATLPPIEVLKAYGVYWVVDGHNRVAAALYGNQVAIDALVRAVRLPGQPIEAPGSLASMLGQTDELGGTGHFSARPSFEPAARPPVVPAPQAPLPDGTPAPAEPTADTAEPPRESAGTAASDTAGDAAAIHDENETP